MEEYTVFDYLKAIPTMVWPILWSIPLRYKQYLNTLQKPLMVPFAFHLSAFSYVYMEQAVKSKESVEPDTPRDPSQPPNIL